jgi:hypothetical protein
MVSQLIVISSYWRRNLAVVGENLASPGTTCDQLVLSCPRLPTPHTGQLAFSSLPSPPLLSLTMPGSRLKKRASVDIPLSPQLKPVRPPSSPEPHPRSPLEPYPMPSSNPASQYTLMEKLGTGSFGTVYKAMHNESRQVVAVKQIGAFHRSTRSFFRWS